MPTIRPLSDLRNNFNDVSKQIHESGQPMFFTKNGRGDMAVMSMDAYERIAARLELHDFLDTGITDMERGNVVSAGDAFAKLRARREQPTDEAL